MKSNFVFFIVSLFYVVYDDFTILCDEFVIIYDVFTIVYDEQHHVLGSLLAVFLSSLFLVSRWHRRDR